MEKTTAKLILNSTYGKFGQKDHKFNIKLLDKNEAKEYPLKNKIFQEI